MKREHGQHNKKVCDYLNLKCEETFHDWITTTAFYSAIHFLDHALFPCTYGDKIFKDINEAHSFLRHQSNSKHNTRFVLLNKTLPKHANDYNFLIEESQNARYYNYQVNEVISNRAVNALGKIIDSYDRDKKTIP